MTFEQNIKTSVKNAGSMENMIYSGSINAPSFTYRMYNSQTRPRSKSRNYQDSVSYRIRASAWQWQKCASLIHFLQTSIPNRHYGSISSFHDSRQISRS